MIKNFILWVLLMLIHKNIKTTSMILIVILCLNLIAPLFSLHNSACHAQESGKFDEFDRWGVRLIPVYFLSKTEIIEIIHLRYPDMSIQIYDESEKKTGDTINKDSDNPVTVDIFERKAEVGETGSSDTKGNDDASKGPVLIAVGGSFDKTKEIASFVASVDHPSSLVRLSLWTVLVEGDAVWVEKTTRQLSAELLLVKIQMVGLFLLLKEIVRDEMTNGVDSNSPSSIANRTVFFDPEFIEQANSIHFQYTMGRLIRQLNLYEAIRKEKALGTITGESAEAGVGAKLKTLLYESLIYKDNDEKSKKFFLGKMKEIVKEGNDNSVSLLNDINEVLTWKEEDHKDITDKYPTYLGLLEPVTLLDVVILINLAKKEKAQRIIERFSKNAPFVLADLEVKFKETVEKRQIGKQEYERILHEKYLKLNFTHLMNYFIRPDEVTVDKTWNLIYDEISKSNKESNKSINIPEETKTEIYNNLKYPWLKQKNNGAEKSKYTLDNFARSQKENIYNLIRYKQNYYIKSYLLEEISGKYGEIKMKLEKGKSVERFQDELLTLELQENEHRTKVTEKNRELAKLNIPKDLDAQIKAQEHEKSTLDEKLSKTTDEKEKKEIQEKIASVRSKLESLVKIKETGENLNNEIKTLETLIKQVPEKKLIFIKKIDALTESVSPTFLDSGDIAWKSFISKLKSNSPAAKRVWSLMSKEARDLIKKAVPGKDNNYPNLRKDIVIRSLNNIISNRNFYDKKTMSKLLGRSAKLLADRDIRNLSDGEIRELNRQIFETIFPDAIATRISVAEEVILQGKKVSGIKAIMTQLTREIHEDSRKMRIQQARLDAVLRSFMFAIEDDMKQQFIEPAIEKIRKSVRNRKLVKISSVTRTSLLATNRHPAKVNPQATMYFDIPEPKMGLTELIKTVNYFKGDKLPVILLNMQSDTSKALKASNASSPGGALSLLNIFSEPVNLTIDGKAIHFWKKSDGSIVPVDVDMTVVEVKVKYKTTVDGKEEDKVADVAFEESSGRVVMRDSGDKAAVIIDVVEKKNVAKKGTTEVKLINKDAKEYSIENSAMITQPSKEDPFNNYTYKITTGMNLDLNPVVLQDGESVLLNMKKLGYSFQPKIEKGEGKLSSLDHHELTTLVTARTFEILELSTFEVQNSVTRRGQGIIPLFFVGELVPFIREIPLLGELFDRPAINRTDIQRSVIYVNPMVFPVVNEILDFQMGF